MLKKQLKILTLAKIQELIGHLRLIGKKSVISTALAVSRSNEDLNSLREVKLTKEWDTHVGDKFIQNFFRAHCSSIIHSVSIYFSHLPLNSVATLNQTTKILS